MLPLLAIIMPVSVNRESQIQRSLTRIHLDTSKDHLQAITIQMRILQSSKNLQPPHHLQPLSGHIQTLRNSCLQTNNTFHSSSLEIIQIQGKYIMHKTQTQTRTNPSHSTYKYQNSQPYSHSLQLLFSSSLEYSLKPNPSTSKVSHQHAHRSIATYTDNTPNTAGYTSPRD